MKIETLNAFINEMSVLGTGYPREGTTSYCSTERLRLESLANPLSTLLRSAVERLDMLEGYGYRVLVVRIDFKAADEAPEINFEKV